MSQSYIIEIVGISGILLSLGYRIPQIYRTYKKKSAIEISIWMIWIQNLSYVIYIVYGILIKDWVYIASSLLSICQNMIILSMRYYYRKIEQPTIREIELPEQV